MNNSQILEQLQARFPDAWFKPAQEFDGGSGIAWSGEGSLIDGEPAFDYYSWEWDKHEQHYVMGINRTLYDYTSKLGLHWEAHDAGTYILYS